MKLKTYQKYLGCACFPEFLQNFSERWILWSLCLVVFHALTLKLPIQTSLSVVPKLQVSMRSGEKCQNFRRTPDNITCIFQGCSRCLVHEKEGNWLKTTFSQRMNSAPITKVIEGSNDHIDLIKESNFRVTDRVKTAEFQVNSSSDC